MRNPNFYKVSSKKMNRKKAKQGTVNREEDHFWLFSVVSLEDVPIFLAVNERRFVILFPSSSFAHEISGSHFVRREEIAFFPLHVKFICHSFYTRFVVFSSS